MTKHGVRFKPEQIVSLLRQIEVLTTDGRVLEEACKALSINPLSYYRWQKMYDGMKADQTKKLKDLEQDNARLKKMVAELFLREKMLEQVIKENS